MGRRSGNQLVQGSQAFTFHPRVWNLPASCRHQSKGSHALWFRHSVCLFCHDVAAGFRFWFETFLGLVCTSTHTGVDYPCPTPPAPSGDPLRGRFAGVLGVCLRSLSLRTGGAPSLAFRSFYLVWFSPKKIFYLNHTKHTGVFSQNTFVCPGLVTMIVTILVRGLKCHIEAQLRGLRFNPTNNRHSLGSPRAT